MFENGFGGCRFWCSPLISSARNENDAEVIKMAYSIKEKLIAAVTELEEDKS